jgi:hypothetical protein
LSGAGRNRLAMALLHRSKHDQREFSLSFAFGLFFALIICLNVICVWVRLVALSHLVDLEWLLKKLGSPWTEQKARQLVSSTDVIGMPFGWERKPGPLYMQAMLTIDLRDLTVVISDHMDDIPIKQGRFPFLYFFFCFVFLVDFVFVVFLCFFSGFHLFVCFLC